MNHTSFVSWCFVLLGILPAALFGRKTPGVGKSFGVAIAIGVVLFFAINVALPSCVEASLCEPLGDQGILYALYPLVAIPAYWFIAFLSSKFGKKPEW